ncbi:unnamed protein product [Meloidogyne enterolobii]|uniref:Uncharacterized protein n=1 Tax=Meloidogyne enterolobii TaxID=390850 RepID=A0ACB0Z3M9_MELEN
MEGTKLKCPHCPAKVDSRRFTYHLECCVASKKFPCDICGRRFATQKGVSGHLSRFHTADERGTEFKCKYCEQGSNSRKDMDKHEMVHEEAGGPGFRSRSRSRSRGPVENRSETSVQSPATPVYRAANNNSATNYSLSNDLFTTQSDEMMPRYPTSRSRSLNVDRSRSKPAVVSQVSSHVRDSKVYKRPVGVYTWASIHPTPNNIANIAHASINSIHNQREDLNVSSTTADVNLEQNESHINNTNIFDGDAIRKRIAEENKGFANAVKLLRKENKSLRTFCLTNDFQLSDNDPIEQIIRGEKFNILYIFLFF